MTIKTRISKAKQQVNKVVSCGQYNAFRATWAQRGSNPTTNYVQRLEWAGKDKIEDVEFLSLSCTCEKNLGHKMEACPGNEMTVCYHSMAAIIKAADVKNQTVTFFDSFKDALSYSKFGGKLVKVQSTQGDGYGWAVVKEKDNFQQRVNWLRGEVEKGIK